MFLATGVPCFWTSFHLPPASLLAVTEVAPRGARTPLTSLKHAHFHAFQAGGFRCGVGCNGQVRINRSDLLVWSLDHWLFIANIICAHESFRRSPSAHDTKHPSSCRYISQEKDKEKKEKEKDAKDKEKKVVNGHQFAPVPSVPGGQCSQCNKAFTSKEAFHCTRKYSDPAEFSFH